jgi:type I restriction enzyme S subunit
MSAQGQYAQDYSNYQLVYPGDFAMNHMDLLTGWVDISKHEGVTSPDYRVFVNRDTARYCSEYYKFIFQYCYSNKIFYGMGQGVSGFGRWRLPADMFLNFRLPVPSIDEQAKIAAFLEQKIHDIDAVIAEVKSSIEEYRAWKKSIIHETVSKGLDSNVVLKDSGLVWLGKIPTLWSTPSVRNYFKINRGRVIAKTEISSEYEEGLYPVYSSQTKNNGCMGYIDSYDFEEESLTWTTDGANAGTVFYRDGKFNCTNVCGILTLKSKGQLWMPFCNYAIGLSAYNCRRADINGYKIMSNEMASIKFALPPTIEEQKAIANFLDDKCSKINNIIDSKELLIADLEAYKKSLIFEAVTGKRKVV